MRHKIKDILEKSDLISHKTKVAGWIKTVRVQKTLAFLTVNDGSSFANLQIVIDSNCPDFAKLEKASTGASIEVHGTVVKSPGEKQLVELHADSLTIIGTCDPQEYPLQKKNHSFEFLRTIAHLRPRTNTQSAAMRVRNALSFATHKFFQERNFLYIHTPIITSSDCEGSGELFRVTTLDNSKAHQKEDGSIDYAKDFFGTEAYLSVSGQLNVECFACAMGDVYTFGPTFRAENSNTARHLAEFWMIEPEIIFADINDLEKLAEDYIRYITADILKRCPEEILFFEKFFEEGLKQRLENIADKPFEKITYTQAIAILKKADQKFEFPVEWGCDLQSEHERYICEKHFKKGVIVVDYPAEIKAFYMRKNKDDKTVAALDVLVPGVGEIIGGSQREERYDQLIAKIRQLGLSEENYRWYLDLRKFGTVPHAGFGAGLERLMLFLTGIENIREVIPFPRYPGHAEF